MKEQDHVLQRLKIDFSLSEKDKAIALDVQDRLSELTQESLAATMNKVFDEFSEVLTWVSIDQLEVDLGALSSEGLEKEMPIRLEEQLRRALRHHFLKHPLPLPQHKENGKVKPSRLLDIFIFFLEKGYFPWWATQRKRLNLKEMLRRLLVEQPQALARAIRKSTKQTKLVLRLTQNWKEEDRAAVLKLLFPQQTTKILTLLKDFELMYKINPLGTTSQLAFSQLLWRSALAYLFNLPTHQFEEQAFITNLLGKLSEVTQQDMRQWIERTEKPAELSATFIQLISELEDREVIKLPQTEAKRLPAWLLGLLQNLKMPFKRTAKKMFTHYLDTQQLPPLETEDWNHLSLVFEKLWELYPNQAMALIDVLLANKLYREKSLVILSSPLIKKTLRTKLPMLSVHLLSLSQDLVRLLKPYFQGQTSLALEHHMLNHVLLYFAEHRGKSFDVKDLLRSTLLSLVGPQQTNYIKLLQLVRDRFPKRTSTMYLSSDLIPYLNLILEEEGLAKIEEENWKGLLRFDTSHGTEAKLEAEEERETTELVEPKDDLVLLSFYLEHGALQPGVKIAQIKVATLRLLQREPTRLNRWFRSSQKQAQVLTRIVDFFSLKILVPLFNTFKPNLGDFGVQLQHLFQELDLIPKVPEQQSKYFWRLFKVVVVAERNEAFSPYVFTQKILKQIIVANETNSQKASDYLYALLHEEPKPKWFTAIFPKLGKASSTKNILGSVVKEKELVKPKLIKEQTNAELLEEEQQAGTIYTVENAGMTILGPYLPMLLERAGFMKDGEFLNEEAQQRAIYLLEYLVTGKLDFSEHQLVLNKVICGYAITKPLIVDFELEEAWASLCDSLLEAVIAQWTIIGAVSIDAFRESFLRRAGNLAFRKKRWHLQVENKSYDVLMRELPWGIGLINFSWLEAVIQVDWKN